uniref:F-box/LRR-repeat protein 3 n=1 Tax=Erigeron canadensis TaxID=72917 RepID=UPI001CB986FB|nr:F-box/LRR-repeat protein 3 [Erigeron canadensis]
MDQQPNYEELPEEIWELIINSCTSTTDNHESLSLTTKRLLSLTNRLRHTFTVIDQTYIIHATISPFFRRFQNLKSLDLSKLSQCYLQTAIHEITSNATSCSKLESLDISNHDYIPCIDCLKKFKLRVLKCANVVNLRDVDLLRIAKCFPDLEELDISYPRHNMFRTSSSIRDVMVTDLGIRSLACGLKNLIKINLSMNVLLTDKALFELSAYCKRLQEVMFVNCTMITMSGVRFLLQNSLELTKIGMSHIGTTESLFVDPATSGRCLSSISFKDSDVDDEFLGTIVEASIPLKSVSLPGCHKYSVNGIVSLVCAYQSIEILDLSRNKSLSDRSVVDLSRYLHDLVSVKFNFCGKLTTAALLALINNCPFLENVEMVHTNLGKEEDAVMGAVKQPNLRVKSLKLAGNLHLSNGGLVKITSVCPNLRLLDVSSCTGLAGSLGEVFRVCSEIRHLCIQDCGRVKNIGLSMKPLKLVQLDMARSGVNDDGLVEIVVRCTELVKIDLAGCMHLTTNSVKYLLMKCEKLRELNLMGCPNLHGFIVEWMVFTRPSLRKLIPPSYVVTTESQRRLFLRHGCEVCDQ